MEYSHLESEVRLYLANVESLYKLVLNVTDFNIDNNQISNLTSQVLRLISAAADIKLSPSHSETQKLKNVVVETVKELQEESKL